MTLSVVVTSCDSPDLLDRCLDALVRQPEAAEIIVADCSAEDPTPSLRARFPAVRVLRLARMGVPALRWRAARLAAGDIVAAIEARCTPASGWCAALRAAHERAPDAPAIGGPVAMKQMGAAIDWGVYLSEYVAYAPPVMPGPTRQLSGANLSYKRKALEAARDLLDAGLWEAALHERWIGEGRALLMSPATVVFQNGMTGGAALRMRFHYARSYAGERVRTDLVRRIVYALGAPLLPVVLTWRVARAAHASGLAKPFWRACGWVAAFNAAWAAGEFAGYVGGRPATPPVF